MELPVWLQKNELGPCPCCALRRRRQWFIQKTLADIGHFLLNSVYAEEIALRPGLLQQINPQAKLLGCLALLGTVNLLQNAFLLWGIYGALLLMASRSAIPAAVLVKRVWLVVPLFTGIMLAPSLLSWVRPGEPFLTLLTLPRPVHLGPLTFPPTLALTREGLHGAVLIITRVGISVTLAAILTLSTRWHDLLKALLSFAPKVFVATLEMTYRYLFVLVTTLEEMLLARQARDGGAGSTKEQRRFAASALGAIFGKSQHLSGEVYFSMLARGYSGEIRTIRPWRWQLSEVFGLALTVLLALTLYAADKVLGG